MEDFIKFYIKKIKRREIRRIYRSLPRKDKQKADLLIFNKYPYDWKEVYKVKKDKKYIKVNLALMLLHSKKIITWEQWQKHPKFLTREIYENIFNHNQLSN